MLGGQIGICSLYDKLSFVNVEKRVSALKKLQQAISFAPTQLTMISSCSNKITALVLFLRLYCTYCLDIVHVLIVLNSMHEIFVTGRYTTNNQSILLKLYKSSRWMQNFYKFQSREMY
jgi:hypothetical protein